MEAAPPGLFMQIRSWISPNARLLTFRADTAKEGPEDAPDSRHEHVHAKSLQAHRPDLPVLREHKEETIRHTEVALGLARGPPLAPDALLTNGCRAVRHPCDRTVDGIHL